MKNLVNKIDKSTAEIYLYGIIGSGLDIDTNKLAAEIENLRKAGTSRFVFYVNSDGGEVVQGNSLFNYLDRTDIDVVWVVDGIAASMMALLITNPKHTVRAAKHAKFMYHRVQGYVYGNSAEVRAHADMIDTFEQSLIEMMSARMSAETAAVKAEFFTDGTDHWLSAEQAKARGLVDEIMSGGKRMKEPDLSVLTNSRDVFNFYNNQIINYQNQRKMATEKNIFALALGLSQDEDESKVLNQIQGLVNEKKTFSASLQAKDTEIANLTNKLKTYEQAKVTGLINQAIAEKKIGEDERETYTALAEKDFDSTEKVINKLPGVKPIAGNLDRPVATGGAWNKRQEEIKNKIKN
ncbi:MAG: ATP-dependent Clp protease proteolytic subunit [Prevotellaceae bacterium]|jgi:ATP-dependent protease ClpP protease subunit|nr:ATP-dependent Clp protease proteolytic subunit [Prevotellaceae bacterium]